MTRGNFELTVNSTGKSKDDVDYLDTAITVKRQGAGSPGGKFDLTTDDGAQDFDITVTGVTLKDGDKVELKYWPRIQASSGNSGYTRAFCTWKMTAKKDTSGKIILE